MAGADLGGGGANGIGRPLAHLAPSNSPVLNPAALKAAIDTGGVHVLAGLRHFIADMAAPPRVPSMVAPEAFEVGVDLAVTPGMVVPRTPVFQLIQYRPATATVRQVPLLIVPPTINKSYVIDLARSTTSKGSIRNFLGFAVGCGLRADAGLRTRLGARLSLALVVPGGLGRVAAGCHVTPAALAASGVVDEQPAAARARADTGTRERKSPE